MSAADRPTPSEPGSGAPQPGTAAPAAQAPCEVRAHDAPAHDVQAQVTALRAEVAALRERLELVQQYGRIGCFERDPTSGQGRWDPHMYRLWGLPDPGPDRPAPPYDFAAAMIHPHDRTPGAFQRSMQTPGQHEARIRIRRPDGQWRHLHTQWRVEHDAAGRPARVSGVNIDETESRAAAHRAELLNQEMQAALAFAQIGLWHQDARTLHVWPDRRACEMLALPFRAEGYSVDQTRAQAHPDDLQRILASYERTRRTGAATESVVRYPRADGSWRHTLSRRIRRNTPDGAPESYLGVMIDISELVEQQRQAAQAAHRIGLAQAALGLGIWSGQAGEDLAWWDEHMFRLRGVHGSARQVSRAEALGYLHPDDRHLLVQAHRDLDQQGHPWQIEFRVVWPDGTVRWLASRSQLSADPVTGTPHHFGVAWDVTDAHLAQQALREGERARAESEAKTQFLSRISHELRTPLNAVLGFTELMKRTSQALPPGHARWLDHVDEAGQHLLVLIDDMLDLARAEAGQLRLVQREVLADELVASTFPLASALAQDRHIGLQLEGERGLVLRCDPVRLRQVLLNLLSNAVKYTSRGSEVRAGARAIDDEVCLWVADDGPGLNAAQQAELFRPFNRLGAERSGVQGTGIGLSIAKLLVERMGGRLALASEPGRGCRFEIRVPRHGVDADAGDGDGDGDGDTATPAAAPDATCPRAVDAVAALAAPTTRSRPLTDGVGTAAPARVLYIEDNPVNALLVEELLRAHPQLGPAVHLRVAATGTEGLQVAADWQPTLVLVDMQLPDMDGLEVHRRLRGLASLARTPCVALSANAMADDIATARAAGFADYWTKPIQFEPFTEGLQRLLAQP